MESATWCRTPAAASAARRLRPEVSKNSSTALSSNEAELARSITTCAPAMASLRPSPVMSPDDLSRALVQPGRASIPYLDRYSPDRPLVLECFRPQGHKPDKPVVIVQHGMGRNGAEYREAWVPAAERHGLLIVA